MINKFFKFGLVLFIALGLAGCTFIFQAGKRSDAQKIEELSAQLDELARSKGLLEQKLGQEINDKSIKLQMMEKGLVITVVGDLIFDSGKAKIRSEALPLLAKVSGILILARYDILKRRLKKMLQKILRRRMLKFIVVFVPEIRQVLKLQKIL